MVSPESALTLAISEPLERGGGRREGEEWGGRGGGGRREGEECQEARTGGIKESMLREV